jgi:hypothetical protein
MKARHGSFDDETAASKSLKRRSLSARFPIEDLKKPPCLSTVCTFLSLISLPCLLGYLLKDDIQNLAGQLEEK